MNVNLNFFLAANPFFDAYTESDFLGKLIFLGLVALSICSWVIMIHKGWMTYQARRSSLQFQTLFSQQRANPLGIEGDLNRKRLNPFLELYMVLKNQSLEMLNKNRRFGQTKASDAGSTYLSPSDIESVDTHLMTTIAKQTKDLEKNLFVLSTVVSLGPFLGLLGTVWGILTTFSDMQAQTGASTSQVVLGGLSLALATTVLGLLDAIPALIGYNYLKNKIQGFQIEMEGFSTEILAAVEMQYRKVDKL